MVVSSTDDLIKLGHIASAYGLKGWVKILSHTDPRQGIIDYNPWYIRMKGGSWEKLNLEASKVHGKGIVARISGCEDRTAAERLRGAEIAIKPEQLPNLDEDEYYWRELEGLRVFAVNEGADSVMLGCVSQVMATGSNDVLVVKGCDGSLDDKERLLPYLWSQVVKKVDLDAGEIWVDWDPDF